MIRFYLHKSIQVRLLLINQSHFLALVHIHKSQFALTRFDLLGPEPSTGGKHNKTKDMGQNE